MAERLWRNCEAAVGPGDVLVCVGDLAMSPALNETTWTRLRAAPGRTKVLVIGNHDLTGKGQLRVKGFDEVRAVLVSGRNPPLIWTHYPLGRCAARVRQHPRTHPPPRRPTRSRHINVSVEQLDYAPVSLARLRRLAHALIRRRVSSGGYDARTGPQRRDRQGSRQRLSDVPPGIQLVCGIPREIRVLAAHLSGLAPLRSSSGFYLASSTSCPSVGSSVRLKSGDSVLMSK